MERQGVENTAAIIRNVGDMVKTSIQVIKISGKRDRKEQKQHLKKYD